MAFFILNLLEKEKLNMFNNNNNYNSQGVPSFMAYGGVPVGLPKGAVPQNATGGAVPQWALGQQNQTSASQHPLQQVFGAAKDMATEYFKMKDHGYKNLDDYHHCIANYNAASKGPWGYSTAKFLGDAKEQFDFYRNKMYKGLDNNQATIDKQHDLSINAIGRLRGDSRLYNSAEEACAEYRLQNPSFPKKYW